MSERTTIAWCDSTFNPWIGCAKVSPGCANCCALNATPCRTFKVVWGQGQPRHRTAAANWRQPVKWNHTSACAICGEIGQGAGFQYEHRHNYGTIIPAFRRPRVFCGSLCDWLDDEVPIAWLADLLDLIRRTPNLDWLLLTKRPENWAKRMYDALWSVEKINPDDDNDLLQEPNTETGAMLNDWTRIGDPVAPPNVWMGVSAEDQQRWDERVPVLLSIPAAKRFVSVEPMLGLISWAWCKDCGLGYSIPKGTAELPDWVIFGGESGPNARPCNVTWIRNGVKQCREAGVAPFVKQLGRFPFEIVCRPDNAFAQILPLFMGNPKGANQCEWPADLRVQERPV